MLYIFAVAFLVLAAGPSYGATCDENTIGALNVSADVFEYEDLTEITCIFGGTTLPEDIDVLGLVTKIDVLDAKLTGTLPEGLSLLTKLTKLWIEASLTGSVPAVAGLPNLQILSLLGNKLSGQIPFLSVNTGLLYIDLANNRFTGTIPFEFFDSLTNLQSVYLANNRFAGTMPPVTVSTIVEPAVGSEFEFLQDGDSCIVNDNSTEAVMCSSGDALCSPVNQICCERYGNVPEDQCAVDCEEGTGRCLDEITNKPTKMPTTQPTNAPSLSPSVSTHSPTANPTDKTSRAVLVGSNALVWAALVSCIAVFMM